MANWSQFFCCRCSAILCTLLQKYSNFLIFSSVVFQVLVKVFWFAYITRICKGAKLHLDWLLYSRQNRKLSIVYTRKKYVLDHQNGVCIGNEYHQINRFWLAENILNEKANYQNNMGMTFVKLLPAHLKWNTSILNYYVLHYCTCYNSISLYSSFADSDCSSMDSLPEISYDEWWFHFKKLFA